MYHIHGQRLYYETTKSIVALNYFKIYHRCHSNYILIIFQFIIKLSEVQTQSCKTIACTVNLGDLR